jgi:hypothetical protein
MPDINNRLPLIKAVRVATGCGLVEAKSAVQAAVDAGLGMPGLTRAGLEQALLPTGIFSGLIPQAASALLAYFPVAEGTSADPLGNLRVWLRQAGSLGDYALVPLPGKTGGAQLTVLDLRRILEQIES